MAAARELTLMTVLGLAANLATANQLPVCTDGGTPLCCAATFNGDNVPVRLATDLTCYDLTPATTNCILPAASSLLPGLLPLGGSGDSCPLPQCCHIVLEPLLGLYCGPPPGPCQGPEMPPRCLDVLNGRFGHCPGINPGTGRQVAASQGDAPSKNPLGLDLGGVLPPRDVEVEARE
ncbi:hypothetical protein Tdes44962_MAKER05257 [Teratosphaeria destructans]|uniref:Hydrophobin n=1 Tax=Teratosphaeria destructans TaxID=418781 RepID=A0A9W7SKA3_9PEZI|nr:hypothetical protein Tdes44962_MAKER05257 [Teratosphaeria destructans]